MASFWGKAHEGRVMYEDLHSPQPPFYLEKASYLFTLWSKNVFIEKGEKSENY